MPAIGCADGSGVRRRDGPEEVDDSIPQDPTVCLVRPVLALEVPRPPEEDSTDECLRGADQIVDVPLMS